MSPKKLKLLDNQVILKSLTEQQKERNEKAMTGLGYSIQHAPRD